MNDTTAQVEDRLRALTDALLSVDRRCRAAEQPEVDRTEGSPAFATRGPHPHDRCGHPDPRIRQWTHQLSTDLSALIARAVIERGGGGAAA